MSDTAYIDIDGNCFELVRDDTPYHPANHACKGCSMLVCSHCCTGKTCTPEGKHGYIWKLVKHHLDKEATK